MTVFKMLVDRELGGAIERLSRRLEKLDRDPTPRALAEGCYLQQALDEALAERDRRAKPAATASSSAQGDD